MRHNTYVGVGEGVSEMVGDPDETDENFDEMEEAKETVLPVILNWGDWARMATPVGFCWTKLIWKPLPIGQPLAGPSTLVEPAEVRTLLFKMTLMFGVFCCRGRSAGGRTMQMSKWNVDQAEVR